MLRWRELIVGSVLLAGLALVPARAQNLTKIEIVQNVSHSAEISAIAFSADNLRVVSAGSFDKTLKLWDVPTGRLIRTFVGHSAPVVAVAFSPDGTQLLSGGWDRMFTLWNLETGELIRTTQGHQMPISSVAFTKDGGQLVTGSWDDTLKLWETTSGKFLRSFEGHSDRVESIALSPDGRRILSGSRDKTLRLWDIATGQHVRSFHGHSNRVIAVAFSPDGTHALSAGGDHAVKLWNVASGQLARSFDGHSGPVHSVAFSPDGLRLLSGGDDKALKLWDAVSGRSILSLEGDDKAVYSVAFSSDGTRFLSGGYDRTPKIWEADGGRLLRTFGRRGAWASAAAFSPDGTLLLSGTADRTMLWGAASGKLIRAFEGISRGVRKLSPDGTRMLSGSGDKGMQLWDVASGKIVRTFVGHSGGVNSVAFAPDGSHLLSGSDDKTLKLWDIASGQVVRNFEGHSEAVNSVAFSPDGLRVLSGSRDKTLKLWDARSGRMISSIEVNTYGVNSVAFSPDGSQVVSGNYFAPTSDHMVLTLWDPATGRLIRSFEDRSSQVTQVHSVAFSPDGTRLLSGGSNVLKLWNVATGHLLRTFEGHSEMVVSVAFSPNGHRLISGSGDGTVRLWNTDTGEQLVSLSASVDGKWLAMTKTGFFDASANAAELLTVVRGLQVTGIEQVHQSLFSPDLLREALAEDPTGELQGAANSMNLEKVLASGPAPEVVITSHREGSQSPIEVATLATRIADRGKGVGRIEWRVNGLTVAVRKESRAKGPIHSVTQKVPLDPGDNTIEVVAYNASNVLASLPARVTIKYVGPGDQAKPKLHILAVGINAYVDRGWMPAGQSEIFAFSPLGLAVKDATTFGEQMRRAAAGLYADVRLTTLLDRQATRAGLRASIDKLAAEIHPRDTFVLFAAAHGKSEDGRFYLIPQDYDGGPDPAALAKRAVNQDMLQDWLANRIKAKKAIILLDTCESGALVGGYTRSRIGAPASEAALGRLHEATGRPVLTAAAEGKPAFEGYQGHGVFTWSLLDALKNGDRNGNGTIELSELVAHVQDNVPKLAAQLNGRGLAAIAVRGSVGDAQSARFGSKGEDFTLAGRLQ